MAAIGQICSFYLHTIMDTGIRDYEEMNVPIPKPIVDELRHMNISTITRLIRSHPVHAVCQSHDPYGAICRLQDLWRTLRAPEGGCR